jgi:hypothetical protein
MTSRARSRLPLAVLALLLAGLPATALGQGRGANVRHVKNLSFPDIHPDDELKNSGTDIEFAAITLPAPAPARAKTAKRKKCRKGKRGAACRRAQRRRAAQAPPAAEGPRKTFAFAGSYGDGLQIFDITNPEDVRRVATWDCGVSQGDVQVFQRKDLGGRWFVAYTHDTSYDFLADSQCAKDLEAQGAAPAGAAAGGPGTWIAEVTDPYAPKTLSFLAIEQGSHNQTVHPSGKYLYNSNSDLITSIDPAIEIADISDPSNPKLIGEAALETWPGLGTESHDLSFSADGKRAYVAALSHGEILDTTDPAKPVSIGRILDPAINVWHQLEPITIDGRSFLIAEDEFVGATETGQCPNGGVHVYDMTADERNPVKVGAWNITDTGPTEDGLGRCTAHVFQLHPKERLMTIAFYNGGVRVVDLSTLAGVSLGETGSGMKQVGWFRFPDSDTWAVKTPTADRKGFYMYANDHRRGLDVFRWTPGGGAKVAPGRWLTPRQSLATARAKRGTGPPGALLCLIDD